MSVSLRRRGLGLSDTYTRPGELASPKRDGVEVAHVERDFSSRRGFVGFERTRISPKCGGLA